MALPDEFFGQIGDDPLGAPIEQRRNTFIERRYLGDFHRQDLLSRSEASTMNQAWSRYGEPSRPIRRARDRLDCSNRQALGLRLIVSPHAYEGPLTERIAGAEPRRQERVLMPQSRPPPKPRGSAGVGWADG